MNRPVCFVRGRYGQDADSVSRSLSELVEGLRDHGANASIVSWPLWPLRRLRPSKRSTTKRIEAMAASGWRTFVLCRAVREWVKKNETGVVVFLEQPTGLAWLSTLTGRCAAVSYVMDFPYMQAQLMSRGSISLGLRLRHVIDVASMKRVDEIVVLGSCMAELVRQLGLSGRPTVIPIWQQAVPMAPGALRSSLGLGADELVLLYAGHAARRHPLSDILAIADFLVECRITLIVIGDGDEFEAMQKVALRRRLNNARFMSRSALDFNSDQILALGDVHLVSLADAAVGTCVPSKTYAAMAAARPVLLLGDNDGQAAIDVRVSGAGLVVAHGDLEGLRSAIARLTDEHYRHLLGENGRRFQSAERSLQVAVRRWQEFLERAS